MTRALRLAPFLAWLLPAAAVAQSLEAVVTSAGGDPVRDAVVYAEPLGADGAPLATPPLASIDQVDKEYVPYVTAVRVGTQVQFPNRDQIRHHVYSFSEAKNFEIPLYKGVPPEPILFDKPGVVVLGCNIHDWMSAYVFVTETPHFAVTDAQGRAVLSGLSAGRYRVQVWHPELAGAPESTAREVSLSGGGGQRVEFAIEQRRVWRQRRAPGSGGGGYR
jgi:plastocyanin